MNCLQAHRGQKVVGEVFGGPRGLARKQAEDRPYVHKCFLVESLARD